MTIDPDRLQTLVIARTHGSAKPPSDGELAKSLASYRPGTMVEGAWRELVLESIAELRRTQILDDRNQLRDPGELVKRIGPHHAKAWKQLASKVLPALALRVAPDDQPAQKALGSAKSPWEVAIAGRALGVWTHGPPPNLAGVCDGYAARMIGMPARPKQPFPAEVRSFFLQRELATEPGPPEKLVRLLARREVNAPRSGRGILQAALVSGWLEHHEVGAPVDRPFASEVKDVARSVRDGVFGDRKVFIASAWEELRRQPRWTALSLDDFKDRLLAAHRAGDLSLARADLVAAMNPDLVAASETVTDGASFHFILREAS